MKIVFRICVYGLMIVVNSLGSSLDKVVCMVKLKWILIGVDNEIK